MFGWGGGSDRRSAVAKKEAVVQSSLPETLRSKLVQACGLSAPPCEKTGQSAPVLKRSSTDDLERPGEVLGKGTFGTVKLRCDKHTGEPRAVKIVDKPEHWNREKLLHEAKVLTNLDHPHIIRLFGWHENEDSITMVMEYCGGGEFLDAVNKARGEGERMRESWSALVFKQLFEAMSYCHAKGLVHMDIKSGNILLMRSPASSIKDLFISTPHAIVADLGLAIVLDPNTSWFKKKLVGDCKGTPATMAPEVWRSEIGPKADMWSLGCVLYELFCGRLPFYPEDPKDKRQKTWERLYKDDGAKAKENLECCGCSREVVQLCTALLTVEEKTRPSSKQCCENSWFVRFLPSQPLDNSQMCDLKLLAEAVMQWPKLKPMHRALCIKLASESRGTARFATMFSSIDSDCNGILSRHELVRGLLGFGMNEDMATEVARALDYNVDGTCEYLEFAAACLASLGEEYDEMLKQEFEILDTSNSGKLTAVNYQRLVSKLTPILFQRRLNVEDFDTDGDGQISWPEFAAVFGRHVSDNMDLRKPPDQPKPRVRVTAENATQVQYFSSTFNKWKTTAIKERRPDGMIQLECKPGYWMAVAEQKTQLRHVSGEPWEPAMPGNAATAPKASAASSAPPKSGGASNGTATTSPMLPRTSTTGSLMSSSSGKAPPAPAGTKTPTRRPAKSAAAMITQKSRTAPSSVFVKA